MLSQHDTCVVHISLFIHLSCLLSCLLLSVAMFIAASFQLINTQFYPSQSRYICGYFTLPTLTLAVLVYVQIRMRRGPFWVHPRSNSTHASEPCEYGQCDVYLHSRLLGAYSRTLDSGRSIRGPYDGL